MAQPKGAAYLRRRLEQKRARVRLRYQYYEMKNAARDLNLIRQPEIRWLREVLVSCGAGFGVRVVNENGKYAGWLNHDSSNSGALGIQDANGNRMFSASRNSEGKGTLVMGDSSGNSEVFAQYDTDGVKMWLKSLDVTDATGFANFRKLYVGSEIQLKGDMRIAVDGGGYSGWTWKNIVTADGSNAMVLCHTY